MHYTNDKNEYKKQHLHERKLVQQIKNKLASHKAMITKADLSSYTDKNTTKKAQDFINSDNFSTLNRDRTHTFQK
jgi:uncharacterized protein YbcC (UPF0753/DUF2309 family)